MSHRPFAYNVPLLHHPMYAAKVRRSYRIPDQACLNSFWNQARILWWLSPVVVFCCALTSDTKVPPMACRSLDIYISELIDLTLSVWCSIWTSVGHLDSVYMSKRTEYLLCDWFSSVYYNLHCSFGLARLLSRFVSLQFVYSCFLSVHLLFCIWVLTLPPVTVLPT